ncbi:hypothetical protein CO613_10215 [Lysobacteraceae bacterium NML07-0707]|nr:hypothetical protein CO613_10215 [Xanthomonadaceae bacterium NML07-0707]
MPVCIIRDNGVEETRLKDGSIMRSQTAGLELGNGFHLPFRVGLGNRPPYEPGEYDIHPQSFALGQYGDLILKRYVDLIPLRHKAAK